jgi:transposase
LFEIPKSLYAPLNDERFGETTVYRTTMEQYGMTVTTVITNNPKLFELQLRGVQNNISKCCKELDELRSKLKEREDGQPRRGRGYTAESVLAKVRGILSAKHMKTVFTYNIKTISDKCIELDYRLDVEKLDELKEKILGKSVLVTDHHDWTNEKIVGSYRAQYHVEECFKQLKDTNFLSFRPIRHFTDNNIRVHGFYCVLAFTLSNLLVLEFERLGNIKLTIENVLNMLTEIKQVINIRNVKGKLKHTYNLSRIEGIAKEYCAKYGLLKYAYK